MGYPRMRRTICMYLTYSMNIMFVKPEHHTYNYYDWLCRFSKWSKWQEEIIRVQEEHLSDPNIILLTPKDVSVRVLKLRSGYVKGLGMRPSFSLKTMSSSTSNAYVRQLEECIVELQEANRRQEKERKKENEEREKEKGDRIKYERQHLASLSFLGAKVSLELNL